MKNFKYYFIILFQFAMTISLNSQSPNIEDKTRHSNYINPAGDSARKAYNRIYHAEKGKWKGYILDSMLTAYQVLAIKSRQRQIEFIQQEPNSLAALEHFKIYILNSNNYRPDSLAIIFSYFSSELKDSPLGKSIDSALNKKKSLSLNSEMPDFSFQTNMGEEATLSSFRNQKYVMLCFWDSWCAPCIRSIPKLKKVAETYISDLQLIHVSIDKEESKWLSSLKKYSMPWLQTCDIEPYINGGKVRELYDINFIPQYFLIDKEGKLIYQNYLNGDNEDYTILLDVLQNVIAE